MEVIPARERNRSLIVHICVCLWLCMYVLRNGVSTQDEGHIISEEAPLTGGVRKIINTNFLRVQFYLRIRKCYFCKCDCYFSILKKKEIFNKYNSANEILKKQMKT